MKDGHNIAQIRQEYFQNLKEKYSHEEISIIFNEVEKKILGEIPSKEKPLNKEEVKEFEESLQRIYSGEPLDYVLGKTYFYKNYFNVNSSVLIPRPETEELIDWVIEDFKNTSHLKILDIGTGSGVIAISLQKNLANSQVTAIDVSEGALLVAKQNNKDLFSKVEFLQQDFLKEYKTTDVFDIIVSNPPYVRSSEPMDETVRKFEPKIALFVDENPLIFYERIVEFSKENLKDEGSIYVEINQYLAKETEELFQKSFLEVELRKDISGNFRMIKAQKKR